MFQNDVGLLAYQYADGIQLRILSGDVNINFGAVYENAVAQELHAQGFEDLYYFNSKKQGEVDFLIEGIDGTPIPIEVKSGKDYEKHNALNNLLSNADYDIIWRVSSQRAVTAWRWVMNIMVLPGWVWKSRR